MTFFNKCYEILEKVPKGRVTTYKKIAQAINTQAYRAVGNAMNKNPYIYSAVSQKAFRNSCVSNKRDSKKTRKFLLIPCHRVVKSNGEVEGFARGTREKIKLLKKEGIEIKNNKVDLKKYLYDFESGGQDSN